MVSVKDALVDRTASLGATRNHETMEAIAGILIARGATNKDKALRLKTAVKLAMLHGSVSQANAYRIFSEKPGFVVTRNKDDDKVVYYEWEELQELVKAQKAEHYPKNFGALTGAVQAEFKPEPAWNIGDAWRGDILAVPLIISSQMPQARDFLLAKLPGWDRLTEQQVQSVVCALATMWKSGFFNKNT